jgi:hypothetical protein
MHDPKPRPNSERYTALLRSRSPQQKLEKVFELGELGRSLMRIGVRQRNPQATEAEVERLVVQDLLKCHNRNY